MTEKLPKARPKVLIVDDDPSIVRALSVYCTKIGLEVQSAENGLQAILRATRNPPHVAILDLQMPEADGFRVCEWLLEPSRPPVAIILLTARTDPETLARCESLGVAHVRKGPNTWELLRAALVRILALEDIATPSLPSSKFAESEPAAALIDDLHNKVLIVDDDSDLVAGLVRKLKKCSAIALSASDGVSGYRLAVAERPDVVVTDYSMPDGSGHYMIWRLKSTESTKRIPIIVISGQKRDTSRGNSPARDTAGLGGPVAHFQKPLDVDALLKEIGRHCTIRYNAFESVE